MPYRCFLLGLLAVPTTEAFTLKPARILSGITATRITTTCVHQQDPRRNEEPSVRGQNRTTTTSTTSNTDDSFWMRGNVAAPWDTKPPPTPESTSPPVEVTSPSPSGQPSLMTEEFRTTTVTIDEEKTDGPRRKHKMPHLPSLKRQLFYDNEKGRFYEASATETIPVATIFERTLDTVEDAILHARRIPYDKGWIEHKPEEDSPPLWYWGVDGGLMHFSR